MQMSRLFVIQGGALVATRSIRLCQILPVLLMLGLAACSPPMPETSLAVDFEEAAFLSVGGSGPDDVWVVGAQRALLEPASLLHWNGADWNSISSGQLHAMWWVHVFEDGPTFVGGGGATVLRIDGGVVERTATPEFFGNTVYGVWGATPEDLWAVGGFAGRAGFVWRFDGTSWTSIALPDGLPRTAAGEMPALFKVWGRASDDVWFCGGLGVVLHWNGAELSLVSTPTSEQLFTVTGNDEEVVIVGGGNDGLVLRGGLEQGFSLDTPVGAPLLQGVAMDSDGSVYVAGAGGYSARKTRPTSDWEVVPLQADSPQSVHAIWLDGAGGLWGVGGSVLSPALDNGVVSSPTAVSSYTFPDGPGPGTTECPEAAIDRVPDGSIARRWIEQALDSIRRDIPHPPVHARNLHHLAIALFDAWAAYDPEIEGYVHQESVAGSGQDRETAISYAALRLLQHRFQNAIGGPTSLDCYDRFMDILNLDPAEGRVEGDDPIAVGNRIGAAVIARFLDDGANETEAYEDTTDWVPANPVMVIDRPGTNVEDVNLWQQLNLGTAQTQNGLVLEDSVQPYIGPQWRNVEPFALERDAETGLYSDLGDGPPLASDADMADWVIEVLIKTAELDVDDGVMIDVGPGSRGNNTLGTNDGGGYSVNPVSGEAYEENLVKRGDFTRVVAEMWADGPTSETPPGHWVKLTQEISDRIEPDALTPWGQGSAVDRLAWDVGFTFSVAAAVHDAAIAAWELKRETIGARPITLIRWMADNGQRSNPEGPSYHLDGLPLVDGVTELITAESSAPGERHEQLRWYVGEVAVWSWPGEPGDRLNDHTPLQWIRARDWIPYQRRTFVTPAFPGFVSGHSTFSRSAATVMAAYTGSEFFPGGLHEFVAPQNGYLKFEQGPSVETRLQWATYFDAADEAGQSRLWGGIHVWPDDQLGRFAGAAAGELVVQKAMTVTQGTQD